MHLCHLIQILENQYVPNLKKKKIVTGFPDLSDWL